MKCPVCPDVTLVMSERQGIEIDYCPQCRGVWLDRGELDKIIERAQAEVADKAAERRPSPPPQQPAPQGFGHGHHPDAYGHKPYPKKQKSWLSDIFD